MDEAYSYLRRVYVCQSTKGAPNFRELRKGEVHVHSPRTLAISPTTSLLCLDEFDALSLLCRAGQDGVYL